jgi:thiamine transport system substrate-binding protein
MLARAILEKEAPRADLLLGIDQFQLQRAIIEGIIQPFVSSNIDSIERKELLDPQGYGTPMDYGALALLYDANELEEPPTSFKALLQPKLRRSIIIQDPRTSSTGLSFLMWTIAIFGEDWEAFWEQLQPNILTVVPGWSESFMLFESGEAPIMVSYATDGAYSQYHYQSLRYQPIIPSEGAFVQIEYAVRTTRKENRVLAEAFLDYILTEPFQKHIPLHQWMYPVISVELPEVYVYAPHVDHIVSFDTPFFQDRQSIWIQRWAQIMR